MGEGEQIEGGKTKMLRLAEKKHDILSEEDLEDSGHKPFSGVRWEREDKPGRHGDWQGEGWNRLQTISRLGGDNGCLHDAIWRPAERTQVNTILHIVLFQLGQDVFSIRVFPQGGNVRPDLQRHKDT